MPFEFGDVILVPFPFTDQTQTKKRPAIVVSSAEYNHLMRDVVLLAVTSQPLRSANIGEFEIRDWNEAGLLKPSVVKPLLATLDATIVIRSLGHLSPNDRVGVRGALEEILGS